MRDIDYTPSGEKYTLGGKVRGDCEALQNVGVVNKVPELPALEHITSRLQNLAARLNDTNYNTNAFIERVVGPEPANPSGMKDCADISLPKLASIDILLDVIEAATYTAEALSGKLKRIG